MNTTFRPASVEQDGDNHRSHERPGQERRPNKKAVNWSILSQLWVYWIAQLVIKLGVGLVFWKTLAEGCRVLAPPLAGRPPLDGAGVVALGLTLLVWWFWGALLREWLLRAEDRQHERWDPTNYKRVLVTGALVVLLVDAYCLYAGIRALTWGESGFDLTTLVFTIGYIGLVMGLNLLLLTMRQRLIELKKED